MRHKNSIRRELVILLSNYDLTSYTGLNAYILADKLLTNIDDIAKTSCKSSIWTDQHN